MLVNKRHFEKEPSAYLVYKDRQNQQKKTVEVSGKSEFTIGRDVSSDIIINNPAVSKTHCIIKNDENGDWILYDKSLTGVFINKKRVPPGASYTLCEWDIISVTGPSNYPFCFYTDELCQKKKKKLIIDTLSEINNRNKERNEGNSSVILHSREHIDQNSSIFNLSIDKVLTANNAKAMVKEYGNNEESTSSLRLKIKEVDEKLKLKEQTSEFAKAYLKNALDLKLEIKMAEFRKILSNAKIQKLTSELAEIKGYLLEKDNELNIMEAKLFYTKCDKVKEKDDQNHNEETLKFNEGMMKLLENELHCPICREIVIEAHVFNCGHLICYFCIEDLKKKRDCPVCKTKLKKVIKGPAIDSFINKILQTVSFQDQLENRKRLTEYRKKNPRNNKS